MNEKIIKNIDLPVDVEALLPHRPPFLFVDKVIQVDVADLGSIIAQKNVTRNEWFFDGHFPNKKIFPGVLLVEGMAQAGGILGRYMTSNESINPALIALDRVKFRRPVSPGDVVYFHVVGRYWGANAGRVEAKALVEDRVVASATISFVWNSL